MISLDELRKLRGGEYTYLKFALGPHSLSDLRWMTALKMKQGTTVVQEGLRSFLTPQNKFLHSRLIGSDYF